MAGDPRALVRNQRRHGVGPAGSAASCTDALQREVPMKPFRLVAACLLLVAVAAGCAKTTVTSRSYYEGERIPRPTRIIVYDFAASAADLPHGHTPQYPPLTTPPTADETDVARKLGAEVAKSLVEEIQTMGRPAVRAAGQPPARPGEIVIMGYFVSIDEGNIAKRMALGFGSGSANLKTEVVGYLMTDKGLQPLGS